ncbi:hypothetical protein [Streptomyces sp. 184]|uniref:hypothetical protein n=1 Tax=Streptomyces sp. 184 TaxID=1827526 RepID=UPI00389132EB
MEEVPSVHVSTRQRLLELLGAAGFEVLDAADIGRYTRHSGRRGRTAFEDRRQELTAAYGVETVELTGRLVAQLAEADEHLGYVVITARVGGGAG